MTWPTHEVSNQAPPLVDHNLFEQDTALRDAVGQRLPQALPALTSMGAELGAADLQAAAEEANRFLPELHLFDRVGNRLDQVRFHPSWHRLLESLCRHGMHAQAWLQPEPHAHFRRAAGYYLHAQLESGSMCPVTMSFASVPLLQKEPALFDSLRAKFAANVHDPRDLPLAHKRGILVGMGMTEKQGGSDVRSNASSARPASSAQGRGEAYLITGHKWFFSAPMCDAHLVLARAPGGLSCFFVPRFRPDGSKNAVLVQQLKDKLGNRSNSSSEVEFQDAWGCMVGEEGRGIPTIIEMAGITRLDCVIGSAGLMRAALLQAIHHTRHRSAFGRPLAQQPLMKNVLCDLALESEAAMHLMLRLASTLDEEADPLQRILRRVMTPAAKFWVCKRALEFTGECMETWGGNGYVETGPMARFYREAPVNSIWEGSGNIMCLDVLRAIERDPAGYAALLGSMRPACAEHAGMMQIHQRLQQALASPGPDMEMQARGFAQDLVLLMQCCLMLEGAPMAVADAFIVSRMHGGHGRVYGTLAPAQVSDSLLERALPCA